MTEAPPLERRGPQESSRFKTLTKESLDILVAQNGATKVIDKKNLISKFGEFAEKFDPNGFDPVQIVRVRTASGDIKELITDGHHRTQVVHSFWDDVSKKTYDNGSFFKFQTRDITDIALNSFYPDPQATKPKELTIAQYLDYVIAPTTQHAEIESKRTVGHMFLEWEDQVGKAVAEKYTAFTALTILYDPLIRNRRTESGIEPLTKRLNKLIPDDDNPVEKAKDDAFKKAVVELDGVIGNLIEKTKGTTNVTRSKLLSEALNLIAKEPEFIGGEERARDEIKGLFTIPLVRQKFGSRILSDNLYYNLRCRISDCADKIYLDDFEAIYKVLVHPNYDRDDIHTVMQSKHPHDALKAIDTQRERALFTLEYGQLVGDRPLSEIEKRLITIGVTDKTNIQKINDRYSSAKKIAESLPKDDPRRKAIEDALSKLHFRPYNQMNSYLARLEAVVAKAQKPEESEDSPTRLQLAQTQQALTESELARGHLSDHVTTQLNTIAELREALTIAEVDRDSQSRTKFELQARVEALTAQVAALQAQNTALQRENTALTVLLEAQTSPPPTETVVFEKKPSIEQDIELLETVTNIAKEIFTKKITPEKWIDVQDQLRYGEFLGEEAIYQSLIPHLNSLLAETKWKISKPQVQLLIASHFINLVTYLHIPGVESAMRSSVQDYKAENELPYDVDYTRLLQILLYADPQEDSDIRKSCKSVIEGKSKKAPREIVDTYLRNHKRPEDTRMLPWNHFIRSHMQPATAPDPDTSQ